MAAYLSPGVYVEEVPSSIKAIAGVSTSTPGFIGTVPDGPIVVPVSSTLVTNERIGTGDGADLDFNLSKAPVRTVAGSFEIRVNGAPATGVTLSNTAATTTTGPTAKVTFGTAPATGAVITADYIGEYVTTSFTSPVPANEPRLCTTFSDFKKFFGDFSEDAEQRNLAHAVYGFFINGGGRCYVARVPAATTAITTALGKLAAIDEIALVAAPGRVGASDRSDIVTHCVNTGDRFAILDSDLALEGGTPPDLDLTLLDPSKTTNKLPKNSDYAAFYFPWIQVFDPATKIGNPRGNGLQFVPPSGHVAGIYARVDTERGVHKAPGNEVVRGALGLKYQISKAQQDGLNPQGVNVIRELNGNIRVWGARTIGGNANADLKYINVRRTLLFLRESIDEGTQWVVFEPNTPALWQKITRNVTAFLTVVWRSGALFGTTAAEAFYVKCDAETNPPELRELGQVVTEIGVAIVRPAEFVIFRISQFSAPSK
jgi:phage tail sheath protein FI